MKYLISFDLENASSDRYKLIETDIFEKFNGKHILTTTYIFETSLSINQVNNLLKTHFRSDDRVLITELGNSIWSSGNCEEFSLKAALNYHASKFSKL